MWADTPDCPACATGWHTRCRRPQHLDDGQGPLLERCCDGLLVCRRRRPWWMHPPQLEPGVRSAW